MAKCWVEGPQEACYLIAQARPVGPLDPFHFGVPWLSSTPQVCQVCPYPSCRQEQSRGGQLPQALEEMRL